jgi:hypothetical protein
VDLIAALGPFFKQVDRTELGNRRVLLVFERRYSVDEASNSHYGSQAEAQAE